MAQNSVSTNTPANRLQQPQLRAPVDVNVPYSFNTHGAPTRLAWAGDLKGALSYRHRVTQAPHLSPASDPTINRVIAHRELYIRDMVQAVFNMDHVNDNPTFRGLTMFTRGHKDQISGYDVEAACRALFDSIIHRCQVGYCGSVKANRQINQGKNFEHVDRDGNCETRIANVIKALRYWKSVCKEVVLSDVKIDHLANAPASIWQDKMYQKKNNQSKKDATQKDRNAAASIPQGATVDGQAAATGDQIAIFPAVPSATGTDSLQQDTKQDPRQRNRKSMDGESSAAPSQPQVKMDEYETPDQTSYSGSTGEQSLPLTSDFDPFADYMAMSRLRPAYMSTGAHNHRINPSAHGSTQPSSTQQQTPSFLSEMPQALPSTSYTLNHGQGVANQPAMGMNIPSLSTGGFGGSPALVNNFQYFSGPNSHYNFGDLAWSPNQPMLSPYETFNSTNAGAVTGSAIDNLAPSVRQGFDNGTLPDSTSQSFGGSQPPILNKTASKHSRTATMDAQFQPLATRVKRDAVQDDVAPVLEKDDEE